MASVTLTLREIRELADYAGFCVITTDYDEDEFDTEVSIIEPDGGYVIADEDGSNPKRYARIAMFGEYPEEGAIGLGLPIPAPTVEEQPHA